MVAGRSARQIAREIRALLADEHSLRDGRLPPIRALAQTLGAGQATIISALRLLVGTSEVEQCARSGAWRKPGSGPPRPRAFPAPRAPLHERVAEAIRQGVIDGRLVDSGGELCGANQLLTMFSCSGPTLRKAIHTLVERGIVTRQKRRIQSAGRAKKSAPKAQVFFAASPRKALPTLVSSAFALIDGIERQIERLGWGHLRLFLSNRPHQSAPPPEEVAGYIFLNAPYSPWVGFLLKAWEIPLVIVDPAESSTWFPLQSTVRELPARHYRNVTRLLSANRAAGTDVGRYLLSKGRDRIAYINAIENSSKRYNWVDLRFEGLREIFADSRRFDAPPIKLKATTAEHELRHFEAAFREFPSHEPFEWLAQGTLHQLRSHLSIAELSRALTPFFESVFARRSIDTWVCSTDECAAAASMYLASKGVSVPDDRALLGFDNSTAAHVFGLTSYDFCLFEMGTLAVNVIASPRNIGKDRAGNIVVPGRLIERATT